MFSTEITSDPATSTVHEIDGASPHSWKPSSGAHAPTPPSAALAGSKLPINAPPFKPGAGGGSTPPPPTTPPCFLSTTTPPPPPPPPTPTTHLPPAALS